MTVKIRDLINNLKDKALHKMIKVLVASILLLLIIAFSLSLLNGYIASLDFIIQLINEQKYSEKIYKIVTVNKFHYLQLFLLLVVFLLSILLYFFNLVYSYIKEYARDLFLSIKRIIYYAVHTELKYVLIIPILASIYFAINLPVFYDEAWTYINFTSKGILVSLSYYPAPNNHMLNSVISNFTKHIFILSPLLRLRLSSIIATVLVWIVAFYFLLKYYNKNTALLVVALASMMSINIDSSYMARGYAMLNLFFITTLLASFNIIKENSQNKQWIWFAISSILGFFTIPSFLYPFLTLNLLIFIFNPKGILKQFISNIFILIGIAILYLPLIIVNGLEALINNQYISEVSRTEVINKLPTFFYNLLSETTGIPWFYVLPILILSLIIIFLQRKKEPLLLFILFISCPFILLLLHSRIAPSRVFIYYGFIIMFLIALPLSNRLPNYKTQYLVFLLIIFQSAMLIKYYIVKQENEKYDRLCKNAIDQIAGNKNYFVDHAQFDTPLIFELKTRHYDNAQIKYLKRINMSADTLTNYDYIIIDKRYDKSRTKVPIFQNMYFNIY